MHGTSTLKDLNDFATVDEYRKAVIDGATTKATAIKTANPDLSAQFEAVDKTVA